MRKYATAAWCFFPLILFAASCTEFFSTSWAPWAARDTDKLVPPVTAANVEELVDTAEDNPDLSFSVLKKIEEAAAGAGGDDASSLQAAALGAASNATGLGSAIINQAGELMDAIDNPDNAKALITNTLNEMQHLGDTSGLLTSILPDPGTEEFTAFAEKATADDLAVAAAIMLAAEAQKQPDVTDYFNKFNPDNPLEELTQSENLAVELAKAAAGKEDFQGRLQDILGGLNLTPGSGGGGVVP